ncbi:MAG: efflux RND transporter periplasmic adaptor subunit [Pirellulales bacterium]
MSQSTVTRREYVPPVSPPAASGVSSPAGQDVGTGRRLQGALSTAAVVIVLAGVAAWGFFNDWKLPAFSGLVGNGDKAPDDWCEAHGVPESVCIECNAKLVPRIKDYGWCKAHGIAQCPLEQPDIAQPLTNRAEVSEADFEQAERALGLLPRTENNSHCTHYAKRIQFASIEALEKAGVGIFVVKRQPIIEAVVGNGEVVYDETHSAHLASRVEGTVWRVEKQVGDTVRKGDLLALVESAEIGKAKTEFLQTISDVRLTAINAEKLRAVPEGAIAQRQVREAEAAYQSAQIRLMSAQQSLVNLGLPVRAEEFRELDTNKIAEKIQFLGLPPAVVSSFNSESTTSNLFPLRSPLDGVVVSRAVVAGEVVDTRTTIFGVADVRRMWLMLDVRQEDAQHLSLGQKVLFHPSDRAGRTEISGTLDWISTATDDQTRTVKVRVNLPNEEGRLRSNTFGTGRIVLRDEPRAIVVPTEAVHWDGCCKIVFVRDKSFLDEGAPKFFHIRQVRLGVADGETTEIIAGLLPGEVVASKNSVVLEAQLLKSNLGAGCCEAPTK